MPFGFGDPPSTPTTAPYDPSKAIGGGTATAPAAGGAPTVTPQMQATLASIASQHGGMPTVTPIPNTAKNSITGTTEPDAAGNLVFTFPNGDTAVVGPNGELGAVAPAKVSTAATPTPGDVLAQSGTVVVGSGANTQIWTKTGTDANGKAIYTQTDESKATQALNDAKTSADTAYTQAQTKKTAADAALASDPTNTALQQAKTAADTALAQAQTASQTASAQATTINSQIAQAKAGPDIDLTKAQTTNTAATTAATQASTNKTLATTPYDVQLAKATADKATVDAANDPTNQTLAQAKTAADTAYQQALTQSVTQKGNEPTLLATGTTAPTNTFWNPATGKFEDRPNAGYVPTDPGRMTVQLQQQASQKQQDLQQQVTAGKMTSDQAASQFDQWWTQNIEPVKGDIAQAQAKAQSALDLQNAQTSNYQMTTAMQPATLAQTASDNAQRNTVSMLPYVTGKGFDQAFGQALSGGWKGLTPQAVAGASTYSLPNLQEIGRQGAAAALANISPTAQMHLQTPGPPGQPPVPGMPSPQDLLNRSVYGNFGGAPGGGAPGGGAPGGGAAPGAAPGSNYNPNDPQWNQPANPASVGGRVVGPGGVIYNAQGQPEGTPPGMTPGLNNGAYQPLYPQAPAAGMPATGPVVGAGMGDMAGWGAGYGLNLNNLVPWGQYTPST